MQPKSPHCLPAASPLITTTNQRQSFPHPPLLREPRPKIKPGESKFPEAGHFLQPNQGRVSTLPLCIALRCTAAAAMATWREELQRRHRHNLATIRHSPLSEASGALGDLGTLLPLMIALAVQ